jgi:hypothetical protein
MVLHHTRHEHVSAHCCGCGRSVSCCKSGWCFSAFHIRCSLHPKFLTSGHKVGTKNAQIIAAIVVDETKKVINRMASLPLAPDNVQKLAPFQKYNLSVALRDILG